MGPDPKACRFIRPDEVRPPTFNVRQALVGHGQLRQYERAPNGFRCRLPSAGMPRRSETSNGPCACRVLQRRPRSGLGRDAPARSAPPGPNPRMAKHYPPVDLVGSPYRLDIGDGLTEVVRPTLGASHTATI